MKEKKFIKNKSGITLIALVITMVVLLILAGISFIALRGDNGLINRALNAKEMTELSEAKEKVMLAWAQTQNEIINKNQSISIIERHLESLLSIDDENVQVTYQEESETYKVIYKGYNLEINSIGEIISK